MVEVGDKIKFTASGWTAFGTSVITEIKYGPKWIHFSFKCVEGDKAGRSGSAKIRSSHKITDYGQIVGTDNKTASAVREARYAAESKNYQAAIAASNEFEVGDLVRITSKKSGSWEMKVLEIDYKNGRIKGVNKNCSTHEMFARAKMNWASLTHPDVKVELVQKQAFNPKTDPVILAHLGRRKEVAAKRNETRQRRETIRNMLGSY